MYISTTDSSHHLPVVVSGSTVAEAVVPSCKYEKSRALVTLTESAVTNEAGTTTTTLQYVSSAQPVRELRAGCVALAGGGPAVVRSALYRAVVFEPLAPHTGSAASRLAPHHHIHRVSRSRARRRIAARARAAARSEDGLAAALSASRASIQARAPPLSIVLESISPDGSQHVGCACRVALTPRGNSSGGASSGMSSISRTIGADSSSTTAPFSMRSIVIDTWPCRTASCSGVRSCCAARACELQRQLRAPWRAMARSART